MRTVDSSKFVSSCDRSKFDVFTGIRILARARAVEPEPKEFWMPGTGAKNV